jgi:hypothetical protein
MLLVERVRKLSPQMNVELVGSQEVFGRQADGSTSQPRAGYPRGGTDNIGTLGQGGLIAVSLLWILSRKGVLTVLRQEIFLAGRNKNTAH